MNCAKVVAVGRSGFELFCRQPYGHLGACDKHDPATVRKVYEKPFYWTDDPSDRDLDARAAEGSRGQGSRG